MIRIINIFHLIFLVLIFFTFLPLSSTIAQHQHKHQYRHGRRHNSDPLQVVSSLPCFASIAHHIGGDLISVEHIASGNQDPHFVQPKPSYAILLREADLFITTGLDLEMWVPPLLDKARNKKIFEGGEGFVSAATDVILLEKPKMNPDRSMGDVHVYGNPHIHTSPLNAKIFAENIMIGLTKISPENEAIWEENYKNFIELIDRSLFGDELVDLFGGELLSKMLMTGDLITFLENKEFGGERLIHKLGGWLKTGMPFRGKKVICYHKNWSYFARDFGIEVVDYIEPKPGIPPTAKHVKEVIETIEAQKIKILIIANYFEKKSPDMISQRTGINPVFLPLDVGGTPEVKTYLDLIENWILKLSAAFESE